MKFKGLSLPELPEQGKRNRTDDVHYLAQTPDGESMSVREGQLDAFARLYGQKKKSDRAGS